MNFSKDLSNTLRQQQFKKRKTHPKAVLGELDQSPFWDAVFVVSKKTETVDSL
jgi:hypothetical protein